MFAIIIQKPYLGGNKIMSLIGKEILPFKAQAYKNGEFIEVTEADLKGKWSVVCLLPSRLYIRLPN